MKQNERDVTVIGNTTTQNSLNQQKININRLLFHGKRKHNQTNFNEATTKNCIHRSHAKHSRPINYNNVVKHRTENFE